MKNLSILAIGLLLPILTMAQEDNMKTLFKVKPVQQRSFILAPEFRYGASGGENTTFGGLSAAVLLNNHFSIGANWERNLNRNFAPESAGYERLRSSWGGLDVGYTFWPNAVVHPVVSLGVGIGTARVGRGGGRDGGPGGFGGDVFYVVDPGLQVETNLFKRLKLFAGANYRVSDKINIQNTQVPTNTLSGFAAGVGLKWTVSTHTSQKSANSNG